MKSESLHRALFYAGDVLRGDSGIIKLRSLKRSQYLDEADLERYQLARLNAVLEHAKSNSPFYKKRLRKIKLPTRGFASLQDIPILTKKDIIENTEEIKCGNIPGRRFVPSRTGGSTGEPMRYFSDRLSLGWKRAAVLRSGEWAGLKLGERNVHMMGSQYETEKRKRAIGRLKSWLLNTKDMSAAYINDKLCERYYRELLLWRPVSLWGYPSALCYFAKFIKENYPHADFGFLKSIITSSETLFSHQRKMINEVFGRDKVFDHYGASEFYVAAECRYHQGYHVNADILRLEIVGRGGRQKRPGELGRVILTDLYNFTFPFIRYEIGDVGILSEGPCCACGVKLPKLRKVEGRIGDIMVLSDRILTVPNFNNIFRSLEGVRQYQVVQKAAGDMEVNVIKGASFAQSDEEYLCRSLEGLVGPIRFRLNYVDSIRVPESGKRRYVISEVSGGLL